MWQLRRPLQYPLRRRTLFRACRHAIVHTSFVAAAVERDGVVVFEPFSIGLLALAAMQPAAPSGAQAPIRSADQLAPPPAGSPHGFSYVLPVIEDSDYPRYALEMGIEGTSLIRMVLGPDSRIVACDTDRSAGLAILDEQACRLYRRRARFAIRQGLQQAVARAPVTWRLGEPVPFNMFAMLDDFDRNYPGLTSGEQVPSTLRESELRHCFAQAAAADRECRLPSAPRQSWLSADLAQEPGRLTIRRGRAEGIAFRIDGRRRDLVLASVSGRIGAPCRQSGGETIWCAPRGWSAVLSGETFSILRSAP